MTADRPPLRAVRPSTLQDDLLQDLRAARPAFRTPAGPAAPVATKARSGSVASAPLRPAAPAAAAASTATSTATSTAASTAPAPAPAPAPAEAAAGPRTVPAGPGRIPLLPAVEVRITPLRWSLPRVRLVRHRAGVAVSVGPWRLTVALRAG